MNTKTKAVRRLTIIHVLCIGALALACDDEQLEAESERSVPLASDALLSATPDQLEGHAPVGYDEERRAYVYDRDQDGFPDITEELESTDMFDPQSTPMLDWSDSNQETTSFPAPRCRPGFRQAGPRLCISTYLQTPTPYRHATINCRNQMSHVCTYEELSYLYLATTLDAFYNPIGRYIGNMTADDYVLCGNRSITFNGDPDWVNFEGTCTKNDARGYWCCHDDDG